MLKRKLLTTAILAITCSAQAKPPANVSLQQIGTYETGVFGEGAAEVVAYDAATQRVFVINADAKTVDILDVSNPGLPGLVDVIDVSTNIPDAGGVNSVAVHDGLVAVAVEHDDKQANGWAAFYNIDGVYLNHVTAGALPDMVTFTPNGQYVLVANEGEPSGDYTVDPEGTVTIIDLRAGVLLASASTADFSDYHGGAPAGVRVSGPGASVERDLEPEYITTSHDSNTAWVTLQENNALAIVNIKTATVTGLVALGNKNHSIAGAGLDPSDRDDDVLIEQWPVWGTYMPDAIDSYRVGGNTYLVTANEGDAREYVYDGVTEEECENAGHEYDDGDCTSWLDEVRIKDVVLDPTVFPDAEDLQEDEALGRLKILKTEGDFGRDGDYEELHAYGARSISIWNASGGLVADTGDTIEQVTALALPAHFNSTNNDNDSFDNRSDDKGPEPEGVVVGKVAGRHFAFVGLERVGGVMIFDVTDPAEPRYVSYTNNRDFDVEDVEAGEAGDLGPEGLVFIKPEDSPNGQPLLVVGNEVSGSTTIYQVVED